MTRLARAAAYALVVVLAVELAVWGSFLTASRPLGHAVPLAALVAVAGNLGLGLAGARVLGRRLGAVLPGVLWLAIALPLGTQRSEELVIQGDLRGVAFLVLGTVAAVGAIGATPRPSSSR